MKEPNVLNKDLWKEWNGDGYQALYAEVCIAYTKWLEQQLLKARSVKSCALYVDYKKSCVALKKHKEQINA